MHAIFGLGTQELLILAALVAIPVIVLLVVLLMTRGKRQPPND